ncbi:MAG: hypothetical protein JJV88_00405 [Sulfurovum sp.]|nr:hypothetical protein [Sulfurovaceae bacterium]
MAKYIIDKVTKKGSREPIDIKGIMKIGLFKCTLYIDGEQAQSFYRNPIIDYIENKSFGYSYDKYKNSDGSVSIAEGYSLTREYILFNAMVYDLGKI